MQEMLHCITTHHKAMMGQSISRKFYLPLHELSSIMFHKFTGLTMIIFVFHHKRILFSSSSHTFVKNSHTGLFFHWLEHKKVTWKKKSRTQYVFTISARQGGGFFMGVAFFSETGNTNPPQSMMLKLKWMITWCMNCNFLHGMKKHWRWNSLVFSWYRSTFLRTILKNWNSNWGTKIQTEFSAKALIEEGNK